MRGDIEERSVREIAYGAHIPNDGIDAVAVVKDGLVQRCQITGNRYRFQAFATGERVTVDIPYGIRDGNGLKACATGEARITDFLQRIRESYTLQGVTIAKRIAIEFPDPSRDDNRLEDTASGESTLSDMNK